MSKLKIIIFEKQYTYGYFQVPQTGTVLSPTEWNSVQAGPREEQTL